MMLQWIFKQHEVSHLEPLFKYMVQTSAERDQENSQQQRIKDKLEELQNLLIYSEEKKNTRYHTWSLYLRRCIAKA